MSRHVGGMMYRRVDPAKTQKVFRYLQEHSRVPMLLAANLEFGVDVIAENGTCFGKQMQVAATDDPEQAYRLGKVACREGKAVDCNWTFAPVVDIDYNYHSPITNSG